MTVASQAQAQSADSITGDAYIAQLARYIRTNSGQLSSSNRTTGGSTWSNSNGNSSAGWTSLLGVSGGKLAPLVLTLDTYHLYYVLLRIQEAGFADVGDMDAVVATGPNRRPAMPAASLAHARRLASDTLSIRTGISRLSKGVSSIGSGWWGSSPSTSASAVDPAALVEADLKLIYTAFTLMPSLKLVLQDLKGKAKAIEGFDFPDLPGDRMLPLRAFKNLEYLEVEGIDARTLLFSDEWDGIKHLKVRDCGLEDLRDVLLCHKNKEDNLKWSLQLRALDCEHNDLTQIDTEDVTGLDRLSSLSLRRNLLLNIPSTLAQLTSLKALDLSENMIDTVLAIYKALPALQILNLRGNRIRSLCGMERLLSLETLDLTDNEIEDAGELVRLASLPHLTKVWIGQGNPFLDNPSAHHGNGWRIRFFNNVLATSSHGHHRSIEDLPAVDGAKPSWLEARYLLPRAVESHSSDSPRRTLTVVSPLHTPVQHSTRWSEISSISSNKENHRPAAHQRSTSAQASGSSAIASQVPTLAKFDGPTVRSVRKKHKRFIRLDDTNSEPTQLQGQPSI